jgi:hypothetical protein
MSLQLILSQLFCLPDGFIWTEDDDLKLFNVSWGFTVYRTCYTAESEKPWQTLTEHIKNVLPKQLLSEGQDETGTETQQMLSLLRLDFRSDADTLKDLDMQEVRWVFLDHTGGKPVNTEVPSFRIFLLADEEVLADVLAVSEEKRWIKCVQADYIPGDYIPRNARAPYQYFGWMKMTTRSLMELWIQLATLDLSEIAPRPIGGKLLETCKWLRIELVS